MVSKVSPVSFPAASPVVSVVSPGSSRPSPPPFRCFSGGYSYRGYTRTIPANLIVEGTPVETLSIFPSSSSPPTMTPASVAGGAAGKYKIGPEVILNGLLPAWAF